MRIEKEQTVAIGIDYQEKLVPVMHKKEKLIENSRILLSGLSTLEVPICLTQQYTKGLGETVPEIIAAAGIKEHVEKISFSAYEDIKEFVKGKRFVILCGIEAHICVLQTVIDLIVSRKRKDLFPVGRLDKDTEGLLLITNDGELAHRLLSPKKHVDKTYYAKVQGIVTQEDVRKFAEGVDIHEKKLTAPAVLEVVKSGEVSEILLTICEGKFHQVKRMFEAVGKKVIYLKRLSMGPLQLDETLMPGEYRELTEKEKDTLCSVEKKQ